jgi:pimeloyl-ACP methyl ester carboxylesterase
LPERVTVPTLILVGEQEDPGREAEAAAAAMPDGQAVYFAGLGHVGVCVGAPEESVARALPFFRRALARAAS